MSEAASEKSIFLHAAGLDSPVARAAYLDEACRHDPSIRTRVDELLAAHDRLGGATPPTAGLEPAQAPPPGHEAGTVVSGRFKLLEVIGEGGMGTVWLAEQTQPVQRRVAFKVIKPGMDSRQIIARFEAERQALALMDQISIARVLDAGTTESGRPYFVMELVHGVPITKYCDDNHLTPRERLELFVPVCLAIQHAHQKGIIHRDIKPSNVMVTLYDGKPVPKVIDFGVAKATEQNLTERTLFTQFGTMVGTLEYMSPEQAEMNALGVDTRSDIYSLGVLLYELLTGSTPLGHKRIREAAYAEILRLIKEEEPPKPSTRLSESGEALASISAQRQMEPAKLSKLMRGELDWIVMKTLEKDRSRRYETASAFAIDLQRYLTDETVLACPPSAMYRFRKFARKNRAALATAGTIAILLFAGIVVSSWQALRATKAESETAIERDTARTSEQRALSSEIIAQQRGQEAIDARDELRSTLYAAEMNLVQAAWESDNLPRVRELLHAQIPEAGKSDLRGFEWHYWDRLSHAEANLLQLPERFPDMPLSLPTFTRDGMRLAALFPKGGAQELQVWDAAAGNKCMAIGLPTGRRGKYQYAISADGKRIATICSEDRGKKVAPFELRVRDADTGNELAAISVPEVGPEQFAQLSMSADGSRILTIINSVSRPILNPFSSTATSQLKVWNVATGKALLTVPLGSIREGAVLSADGARVAAIVSVDGKGDIKSPHAVKMWDVETGKQLHLFKGSSGEPFFEVAFSPAGDRLAATGLGLGTDCIWIWDAATGKELKAIGGRRAASLLRFSPDGKYLANYARSGTTVTLWDAATGQPWSVFKGHAAGVVSVAFISEGRQLRTVTIDGMIHSWTIPPSERQNGTSFFSMRLALMAISPDGDRLAELPMLGSDSNRIEILDVSGKRLRLIPFPNRAMFPEGDSLALSHGGTRLALRRRVTDATGETAMVRVWDTSNSQELLGRTEKGSLRKAPVALSPDGRLVTVPFSVGARSALGYQSIGGVRLIDVTNGQETQTLALNPHPDMCLNAFSPDGKRLVTASLFATHSDPNMNQAKATGQVWDVATGKEMVRLPSDTWGFVSAVTLSLDGSLVAVGYQTRGTGDGQPTIDVLDTATGRKQFTLRGHADRVVCITFSPDGRRIASGALDPIVADSEIRIWDATSGKELSTLTCHGAISGLAFGSNGHQLIGVRKATPDTERGLFVWDATPRLQEFGSPGDKR